MLKLAVLHVFLAVLSLLCTTTSGEPHGMANLFSSEYLRPFGTIYVNRAQLSGMIDLNDDEMRHRRPNSVYLALDQGFTFTAYRGEGDDVVHRTEGPFVGSVQTGRYDRAVVIYEGPPAYHTVPDLPTYDESELNRIANGGEYRGLMSIGFMPFPASSGLVKRGKKGAKAKGSHCFQRAGSYKKTCSAGIWAVYGKNANEECWLCATCPPKGGPEAISCTQALDTCDDISNDLGKIRCHQKKKKRDVDCGNVNDPCCRGKRCVHLNAPHWDDISNIDTLACLKGVCRACNKKGICKVPK